MSEEMDECALWVGSGFLPAPGAIPMPKTPEMSAYVRGFHAGIAEGRRLQALEHAGGRADDI